MAGKSNRPQRVKDEGLRSFAELKSPKGMEELNLNNNKAITDRGLVHLEGVRIRRL